MVACTVLKELAIAIAQVVNEIAQVLSVLCTGSDSAFVAVVCAVGMAVTFGVAANETLVSLANDPRLAAPTMLSCSANVH